MKKKYIGKINGIDYNTYINSLEWREKRTEVAERAKYKCHRCGKKIYSGYHIHHKTYVRFGHELLSDLEFLCPDCHTKLHENRDKKNSNPNKKRTKASCVYSKKQSGTRYCTLHNRECVEMCNDYICRYTNQPYKNKKQKTLIMSDIAFEGLKCTSCGCDRLDIYMLDKNTGAYCSKCGKYIKFLNNKERRQLKLI